MKRKFQNIAQIKLWVSIYMHYKEIEINAKKYKEKFE